MSFPQLPQILCPVMTNWFISGTSTPKSPYRPIKNIRELFIRSNFIPLEIVLPHALMTKRSSFMILDLSMLFKSTKDTKALWRVSISILTVLIWSAHQRTERLKYGTVKREDYNILFNPIQTQQSSAGRAIILCQEGLIRWLMSGRQDFMTV